MTNETLQRLVPGLLDQIKPLIEGPIFLSGEHARLNVLPVIVKTMICVTLIYFSASPIAKRIPQDNKNTDKEKRRLQYQITNLITNTFIGVIGLHAQYNLLPENASIQEKFQGQENLFILPSVQIGFQIWSIIMALFFVEESVPMLVHHVCVIWASIKVAFTVNGFRYFAPIALGMTELSSVPLAIMNSFKNNKSWIDAYPQSYVRIRLVFSFTFLIVRIGIFVPSHLEYLKLSFLESYLAENYPSWLRSYMYINWIGAVFLLSLQLYWGYLIVVGMLRLAFDNQVKVKTKKMD